MKNLSVQGKVMCGIQWKERSCTVLSLSGKPPGFPWLPAFLMVIQGALGSLSVLWMPQNHKMFWVGRDLKDHLLPISLPWSGVPPPRLDCSEPHPTLNTSRDGTCTNWEKIHVPLRLTLYLHQCKSIDFDPRDWLWEKYSSWHGVG